MNTTNNQIIEAFNSLSDKFGVVIDWSAENILSYIQHLCNKIINYELYKNIIWIVLIVIANIVCWTIIYKANKANLFNPDVFLENGKKTSYILLLIIAGLICGTGVLVIIIDLLPCIIDCLVFPEKIILNYLT